MNGTTAFSMILASLVATETMAPTSPAPESTQRPKESRRTTNANAPMGAVYGLGFFGALVYYIQTASSFWMGVFGVVKALLWPAFLVYELLRHLGA